MDAQGNQYLLIRTVALEATLETDILRLTALSTMRSISLIYSFSNEFVAMVGIKYIPYCGFDTEHGLKSCGIFLFLS